jgi:hypothetical protein
MSWEGKLSERDYRTPALSFHAQPDSLSARVD